MPDSAAKSNDATELDELYPMPTAVTVRVRETTGNGSDRKEEWRETRVTVEEMTIVQLAHMARVLGPIASAIKPGSNLAVIAAEHPDEVRAAVAMAVGWQPADLAAIDGPGFFKLATAVFEQNAGLFRAPPRPPRLRMPGDQEIRSHKWGWGTAISYLLRHGHASPENYTLRQFRSAVINTDQIDREDRIAHLIDMRVAFHGDADTFEKHLKQLRTPPTPSADLESPKPLRPVVSGPAAA